MRDTKWTAGIILLLVLPCSHVHGLPPRIGFDLFGDPLPAGAIARMGSGRMRHNSPVYPGVIRFSPDGKSLVSCGRFHGAGLRCWDLSDGKLQWRFDDKQCTNGDFTFVGKEIAFASTTDNGTVTVRLIDPKTSKARDQVTLKERATSLNLALSSDGKRVAILQESALFLYDASTGREMLRIRFDNGGWGRRVKFAPDGKALAFGDSVVHVYDTTSGKELRQLKSDAGVMHVSFSPDGRLLAAMHTADRGDSGEVTVWNLATGKLVRRFKSPNGMALCTAFSPDNKYLAMGCQHRQMVLCEMTTGKEVRRFPTSAYFSSVCFAPNGKTVIAVSGEGVIMHWDLATGRVMPGSADPLLHSVHELRFAAQGKRLIGASLATHIAWDPASGRELRRFPRTPDDSWTRALSPDESLLATAKFDGIIHLWDTRTEREKQTFRDDEYVRKLLFSGDGHTLFSSSYKKNAQAATIRVREVATGRELHHFNNADYALAASPDGRWLANTALGPQGGFQVILWGLVNGREKARFPTPNRAWELVFSSDSLLLAFAGGGGRGGALGEISIWNIVTGKLLYSLASLKETVSSLAFSSDSRMLASGDLEGRLLLWELASGKPRHQFAGHQEAIRALAFSPSGRLLASASVDAPVYVWDVSDFGERLPRKLNEAQLQRCWSELAGADAAIAFRAVRMLAAAAEEALPFLRKQLKPVAEAEPEQVGRLIAALDSPRFAERRKATAELEKLVDRAVEPLRRAAREASSLELRRRLQTILDRLETAAPERLQIIRAVEALELMRTPEGIGFLAELARGAPGARLTREAQVSHQRLAR